MHFGDRCVNGVYSMLIVMNCVLICLVNNIGKKCEDQGREIKTLGVRKLLEFYSVKLEKENK